MRPDRVIVGECRGGEALDMLQAMNTGHDGSMTTVHANDTRDAISRLEMMVGMNGFDIPIWIVRARLSRPSTSSFRPTACLAACEKSRRSQRLWVWKKKW